MKTCLLFISIVVILALVSSPAVAISKSDLIASYKGQSSPTIPTPIPTSTPTPITTSNALPLLVSSTPSRAMVYIDGSFKGFTPITIYSRDPGGFSVGTTHQLRLSRAGYEDYSTEIVIPEPSPPHCFVFYGSQVCVTQTAIPIDVTLKKVESTQNPTIPTIVPSPTPTPTTWSKLPP